MEIRTLPVGQLDTNCYIVWEADGQAVVIDPGAQAGRILDEADAAGVRCGPCCSPTCTLITFWRPGKS